MMKIDEQIASLVEQQKYPEALKFANEYLEKEPNSAHAYYLRGYAKFHWNQPDEAIFDYKQAIDIDPSCGQYYCTLGLCYETLGNYAAARDEFERAIHIEPDNLLYKTYLSRAMLRLGYVDKALAEIERLPKDDLLKEDLAEIYAEAAIVGWHHDKQEDKYFALSHEHVKFAKALAGKAKALSPISTSALASIDQVEKSIKIATKRKFAGGWYTLLLALTLTPFMFGLGGTFGYLYAVSALVYFFALRTPQYVFNHLIYSGKDNLSVGDRIASVFTGAGWFVTGYGVTDTLKNMAKTQLILAFFRSVVRIALLPVSVLTAVFKNYNRSHALALVGVMAAFIVVLNTSDWMEKQAESRSLANMIEAVRNDDLPTLTAAVQDNLGIYVQNEVKLSEEAIKFGHVKMVEHILTTSRTSLSYQDKNHLLDTAIQNNQREVLSYLSNRLFKQEKSKIISTLKAKGPYSGTLRSWQGSALFNLKVKRVSGDSFKGTIGFPSTKATVSVSGKVLGNVLKISEESVISGQVSNDGCEYTLRLYNSTFTGQRLCDDNQTQRVTLDVSRKIVAR